MRLKSHKIEGIRYLAAHFVGPVITPDIVILHDTAGRLEQGSSAAYLASKNTGEVSAHFVIEYDGAVTQLAPTNRRTNHAGKSSYNGRSGCNAFSIGIEIVNPGRMTAAGDGSARAWYGQDFNRSLFDIRDVSTPEHGAGLWMGYTAAQIASLIELLQCLFAGIPTLRDITTHWYVSPGRKFDVNPLFPMAEVRAAVLGHDDPAEIEADLVSDDVPVRGLVVEIDVPGSVLNMRRWPSFNPNIIATIPDGVIVPVLRSGVFEGRDWYQVLYGGQEGWIVASYAALIVKSQS